MTKSINVHIPHPSSGVYAGTRFAARYVMLLGGICTVGGSFAAARDSDVSKLVGSLFAGAVIYTLGSGLYSTADNLEKFHKNYSWVFNKTMGEPTVVSNRKAFEAA